MNGRPSPNALPEQTQRRRGRFKVFLGAAPGVGKTYEMLLSGRARHADGVDVVIGVVEAHGCEETQALVDGFEIIPRMSDMTSSLFGAAKEAGYRSSYCQAAQTRRV